MGAVVQHVLDGVAVTANELLRERAVALIFFRMGCPEVLTTSDTKVTRRGFLLLLLETSKRLNSTSLDE